MVDGKALLRAADLAPLLGVSRSRIYQLIASGDLPAVRIGGAIRVPRAAWEAWLERQRDAALGASGALRNEVQDGGRSAEAGD